MKPRQPHVSRGPFLPPDKPADDSALRLLVGAIALLLLFVAAFVILPLVP